MAFARSTPGPVLLVGLGLGAGMRKCAPPGPESGARLQPNVVGPQALAAARARHLCRDRLSTLPVTYEHRRPALAGAPLVAPGDEDQQRLHELLALLGEQVLVARRMLLVEPALDRSLAHQCRQPVRQKLPRQTEVVLDLV